MTLYDVNFIKHFYRSEPDEELQLKLVFTESKWEREAITLELARREAEANDKPSGAMVRKRSS